MIFMDSRYYQSRKSITLLLDAYEQLVLDEQSYTYLVFQIL